MIQLNEQHAQAFLEKNNLHHCQIKKVAGDASFRSYYRVVADKTYILMFAPPSHEEIWPFINMARWLVQHALSAPQILAIDEEYGFILLEDFGDDSYSRVLAAADHKKELELDIYKSACDCLVEIQKINDLPKIASYNSQLLLKEVMLFVDWYLPYKKIVISDHQKQEYQDLWLEVFDNLTKKNQVVVLRDYHADNLMLLNRKQHQKVGLLDFQDAVIGSKAYDLVSLLEDARRDLDEENREILRDYYLDHARCDKTEFLQDYAILSLQRNIKILGIFCRLSMRDNKDNYLKLLPRVENFVRLRMSSQNPVLAKISHFLEKLI